VSGYLTRLATRVHGSDERQLLRPSARSSSPIAEHDQRIGMAGSEGFELVGAPPDQTRSEVEGEQLAEFQSQSRPGITPSDMDGANIQRKRAAPSVSAAGPCSRAVQGRPPAASERMSLGIPTSTLEEPGGEMSSSPGAMDARSRLGWLQGITDVGLMGETHSLATEKPSGSRHRTPVEPTPISQEAGMVGGESSLTSTELGRLGTSDPDSLATYDTHLRAGQVTVHTRSARQAREIDSPRLEPGAYPFAERFEPSPADASASTVEPHENPRIVIGRINVEVVPPPAAKQVTTASRTGPPTAASVSVIGPLSGGIRSNLRLSLRYR
jgi:hypothetical protein